MVSGVKNADSQCRNVGIFQSSLKTFAETITRPDRQTHDKVFQNDHLPMYLMRNNPNIALCLFQYATVDEMLLVFRLNS